jgi:hypothetical protein
MGRPLRFCQTRAVTSTPPEPVAQRDLDAVREQLGRPPRGVRAVAHRCPCGNPDVVQTEPRLTDGTPFPTVYYLTCPRAAGAIGTLEADGVMKQMAARLADDEGVAAAYAAAHADYLARRAAMVGEASVDDPSRIIDDVPEIAGISAGGMPDRVKCLHVLVGHALAAGPGVNPLGDEALAMLPDWWAKGPCVS